MDYVDPINEDLGKFVRQNVNPHGAEAVIFTAGGQAAFKQAIEAAA